MGESAVNEMTDQVWSRELRNGIEDDGKRGEEQGLRQEAGAAAPLHLEKTVDGSGSMVKNTGSCRVLALVPAVGFGNRFRQSFG